VLKIIFKLSMDNFTKVKMVTWLEHTDLIDVNKLMPPAALLPSFDFRERYVWFASWE
jgi:hypothetical protein